MAKQWPDNVEEFLVLDADQQEDLLLAGLYTATDGERGQNFIHARLADWFPDLAQLAPLRADVPARKRQRQEAKDALFDAYFGLESEGSIRPDRDAGSTFCRVTKKGEARVKAAELPDAARVTFAGRALDGVDLHVALQNRQVDAHFRQGKFETALRDDSTFLEDAVRNLAGPQTAKLVGVNLMTTAFGASGALRDPSLKPGEADGLRNLYSGYFGMIRNQIAHKDFKFASHKEPLQALMLLDYLSEKLDAAAHRLGKGPLI